MTARQRVLSAIVLALLALPGMAIAEDALEREFASPPDSARPWVYWMFMDGNLSREGMTADLEAMKRAGIGGAIILEVNVGISRGPVAFMSEPWREMIAHAVREAERLGIEIALGAGPGWCGTGGPWVKPEQSMQHLVGSETNVAGSVRFDAVLPQPAPRMPFFGEGTLTPGLRKQWQEFYRDVAVLAFPTPKGDYRIPDVNEKALYFRPPYSSQPGVKPFLPPDRTTLPPEQCIPADRVVELTAKLSPEGRLVWDVPAGDWTILRMGRTLTGQTSRPAPEPGLGFESDKFDKAALDAHFESFVGTLLKTVGEPKHRDRGLTTVHFDSWEMSSQNWSQEFRTEFLRRRGYDPLRFLPAMLGRVVDSVEVSERFLWDLRRTAQELVIENHALRLKELGRRHGMALSIEPYDLNPAGDLALGGVADVPMCEFWSKGYGFASEYSCFEAVSAAHTMGRPIIGAESFTSHQDAWRQFPASMKGQGDWALCAGINRIVFHRYQHQPSLDLAPGMTFGPYGVHWERTQTWWDMVPAYHKYLARCQTMLRRGLPVADILYLDAEDAPMVFRPPSSALREGLPDRKGYNFDGCAAGALIERASAKDGRIVFPNGMSYRLLVLPRLPTMTPELLRKIGQLVKDGANVLGVPPAKSPSLVGYPKCDQEVSNTAASIWRDRNVVRDATVSMPSPASALASAKWIWVNEGNPAAAAPVGSRYFRRTFATTGEVSAATFTMTADNSFHVRVNGRPIGGGDNFHQQFTLDAAPAIKAGENLIEVTAENGGDAPNPAGLIGTLAVEFRDGTKLVVSTDGQWTGSASPGEPGGPALELAAWNAAPWHLGTGAAAFDLYPDYESTARILADLGVPPDFETTGDLRYIHRREKGADIYFVGNRTAAPTELECTFRVAGRPPELWDPVTGERRALPEFREQDGRTTVPLRFAPHQSYFVVFRNAGVPPSGGPTTATSGDGPAKAGTPTANFPTLQPVCDIAGPWEVSFDPKWGGPSNAVTFAALEDWTRRPEEGIKFYSGRAVYRKIFDLSEGTRVEGRGADAISTAPLDPRPSTPSPRLSLDLGRVSVMARVRLNGRDLGVAWCEPWQVGIPKGLLQPAGNRLEIEVANLWVNRLVGDAALPDDRRLTSTTWSPYRKDSPLLESGLLGPVRVLASE
jgi:hypothetical protein